MKKLTLKYIIVKRLVLILAVVLLLVACGKKTVFSLFEQDRQNYDLTEWIDGEEWVYKDNGDFWVGVTLNDDDKDDYYRLKIFILNKSGRTVLLDPDSVSARVVNQHKNRDKLINSLDVYSNDELQKKLRKQQNWSVAMSGIATGLGSTDELPQNVAATYALERMMEDDRFSKKVGYLKKTTLYAGKSISGYMFLKSSKGKILLVDIPVGGDVFSFQWLMLKK